LELAHWVESFYRDRRKTVSGLGKSISYDIHDTHSRGGRLSNSIFVYKSLELQASDLEIPGACDINYPR
jgi:hypothetical protein